MEGTAPLPRPRADPCTLAVLGLLALGAGLRVHGLVDHDFWIDEYGTWWTIAGDSWRDVRDRALEIHGQSPFYYFVVRLVTDILGTGRLAMRLPSVVFGVAVLVAIHVLGTSLFRDRRAGAMALAAAAVSEPLIFFSQDARPYSLALLCAVLSTLGYARWLRGAGRGALLGWVLFAVATYYAHYLFSVIVVVQGVHFFVFRARDRRALARGIPAFALIAVGMLPGLVQLVALHERRQTIDWVMSERGFLAALRAPLWYLDLEILVPIAVLAAASALFRGLGSWRPERLPEAGLVLLWVFVPPAVVLLLWVVFGVFMADPRYLLVMLPAVALLYGFLLAFSARSPREAVVIALIFLVLTAWFRFLPQAMGMPGFSLWFRQHAWDEATAHMLQSHRPGDLLLYRTGFVELDLLVRGTASPATREFVEWPIRAHLPDEGAFERRPLPYTEGPEWDGYLEGLLDEAAGRRVWVLGLPPVMPDLVDRMEADPRFRIVEDRKYGVVRLVRFFSRGGIPPPGAR